MLDIKLKWLVLDALGLEYIKLGGELAAVFWEAKEPLVYEGNNGEQSWNYYYANVILGFSEPNDEFKYKYSLADGSETYIDQIELSRKIAKERNMSV